MVDQGVGHAATLDEVTLTHTPLHVGVLTQKGSKVRDQGKGVKRETHHSAYLTLLTGPV
jgi:hypothetical protein